MAQIDFNNVTLVIVRRSRVQAQTDAYIAHATRNEMSRPGSRAKVL